MGNPREPTCINCMHSANSDTDEPCASCRWGADGNGYLTLHWVANEEMRERCDLATLTRLLRCPCGGWLEVCEASKHIGFDAFCLKCKREKIRDTSAEAIMAYHREHGGER